MQRLGLLAMATGLWFFSMQAQARDWGWHLCFEGATDVPVDAGARALMETPYGLRVGLALGGLPGPYVDLINAVVVAAGGYDQDTADLVSDSLQNSLVFRIHGGWRPVEDWGLYIEAGYGLVVLGGGVSGEELVAAATGVARPGTELESRGYEVSSTLHMIDLEVGWEFLFWDRLELRIALGFAGTLGASARVQPDFVPRLLQPVDAFSRAAENYLVDVYKSYVFTPVVTVGLGYQVF
ncbi:MAG: hypothetical protein GXP49_12335 [Deltaproteobacteria bacterium]|nr:hypothetical protein [Deltaproteobacteria bacterium]